MAKVSIGNIQQQKMRAISKQFEQMEDKMEKLAQGYKQQIQQVATRVEDVPSECYRANSILVKQPKSILSKAPKTPLPKD